MKIKELYMAKNLEQLNAKTSLPPALTTKPAKQIIAGAEKLLKQAQVEEDKDEELAYVSYMKFIECFQLALKRSRDNEEKSYYTKLIGKQNIDVAVTKCEKLSGRLKERYNLTYLAEKSAREDAAMEKKDIVPEKAMTNGQVGKVRPGMNGVTTPTEIISKKPEEEELEESGDISVRDLKNLIEQKSTTLLIIDCRGAADFHAGHINHPHCISIPDAILCPGLSAGRLTEILKNSYPSSYHDWNKRAQADRVILYDWNSTFDRQNPPLQALYTAMVEWDVGTKYKSRPCVLQAGIRNVYFTYPMILNKPPGSKLGDMDTESSSTAVNANVNIASIEYPSFEDVNKPKPAPKPVVLEQISKPEENITGSSRSNAESPSPASFDRSKKPIVRQSTEPLVNGNASSPAESTKVVPASVNNNNSYSRIELNVPSPEASQVSSSSETNLDIPANLTEEVEKLSIKDETQNEVPAKKDTKTLINGTNGTVKTEPIPPAIKPLPSRPKIPDASTKPLRTRTNTSPGADNPPSSPVNGSPHLSITKLKDDSFESPRSSLLKRSHSNPNISQMFGDSFDDCPNAALAIPSINRTLKPSNKNFFGESFVRRRDFEIVSSTEKSETGLKNLGNTCYMNSIMQCINHTTTFVNYFLSQTYRKELSKQGPTKGEITLEVAKAITEMNQGHRSIGLYNLKQTFGKYNPPFRSTDQQDSQEFLTFLLDYLHEELNKSRAQKLSEQKNDGLSDFQAADIAWNDFLSSNNSIITELFGGQLRSSVTCVSCNKSSSKFETFFMLSIPIPDSRMPGKRYSLQDCLDLYTAEEEILDFKCESCKTKGGRAKKKIDLWRLPPTLIIHFKRFYHDSYSKKRITEIDFPVEDLNLTKLVKSRPNYPAHYQLYGTSNHYGTMESGHYTAYCRRKETWAKFDDQEVCGILPGNVPTAAAYILFYTQIETP